MTKEKTYDSIEEAFGPEGFKNLYDKGLMDEKTYKYHLYCFELTKLTPNVSPIMCFRINQLHNIQKMPIPKVMKTMKLSKDIVEQSLKNWKAAQEFKPNDWDWTKTIQFAKKEKAAIVNFTPEFQMKLFADMVFKEKQKEEFLESIKDPEKLAENRYKTHFITGEQFGEGFKMEDWEMTDNNLYVYISQSVNGKVSRIGRIKLYSVDHSCCEGRTVPPISIHYVHELRYFNKEISNIKENWKESLKEEQARVFKVENFLCAVEQTDMIMNVDFRIVVAMSIMWDFHNMFYEMSVAYGENSLLNKNKQKEISAEVEEWTKESK